MVLSIFLRQALFSPEILSPRDLLDHHDDQHDEEGREQVGYLDIAIFVTMASKSQEEQHDDKGEYRLDILMLRYL